MRRAFPLFLLLAMLLVTTSCATAVMSGAANGVNDRQVSADSRITREVRTRLYQDALLADARIHVSTRQGVVTLSGHVSSAEAMNRAMVVANGVAGVERVDVELQVKEIR